MNEDNPFKPSTSRTRHSTSRERSGIPVTQSRSRNNSQSKSPIRSSERIRNQQERRRDPEEAREAQQVHHQRQIQTTENMNPQQIQQNIANFVPEFSGANNKNNELTRFLGTADSIYDTLNQDEQTIFNRLIKFRLTGDTFNRINNLQIDNYAELRTILNNMYSKTYSLEELETNLVNTKQTYGETIRNYGYRLSEELAKYKNGYKRKYNLENLDNSYTRHLDTKSIQIFKIGINNSILKEKIATLRTETLEEIINETEITEKMLTTTFDRVQEQRHNNQTQLDQLNQHHNQPNQKQHNHQGNQQLYQVRCNFCQKPNHTWDVCRIRIQSETNNKYKPNNQSNFNYTQNKYASINQNPNFNNNSQLKSSFFKYKQPLNPNNIPDKYMPPHPNLNRFNEQPNEIKYFSQQRTNYTPYRQPQYQNKYETKHCSYCNITGHEFNECRSKFRNNRNYQTGNYNQRPTSDEVNKLGEQFNNMRINSIYPQQTKIEPKQETINRQYNQGNDTGSNQE